MKSFLLASVIIIGLTSCAPRFAENQITYSYLAEAKVSSILTKNYCGQYLEQLQGAFDVSKKTDRIYYFFNLRGIPDDQNGGIEAKEISDDFLAHSLEGSSKDFCVEMINNYNTALELIAKQERTKAR